LEARETILSLLSLREANWRRTPDYMTEREGRGQRESGRRGEPTERQNNTERETERIRREAHSHQEEML
jgi:hypothetical protein